MRRLTAEARLATGASASRAGRASTVNRIRQLSRLTHTIQARCDIGIDRRLLPGETPEAAVADIAAITKTVDGAKDPASGKAWRVELTQGPMMYPALVGENSGVAASAVAGLANRARFRA